jgi:Tfp pilus assembly protein FimT
MRFQTYRAIRGFTLVELLVIVGLLAFLGLCAGTFMDTGSWLAHYRLRAATSDLASCMQNARVEAVKRNAFCTVTFNQQVAGRVYDYVVYVDLNRNFQFDAAAGDLLLKKVLLSREYKGASLLRVNFADNDSGSPTIAFDTRGFARNADLGLGMGKACLGDGYGNQMDVTVNAAGRVRTE